MRYFKLLDSSWCTSDMKKFYFVGKIYSGTTTRESGCDSVVTLVGRYPDKWEEVFHSNELDYEIF